MFKLGRVHRANKGGILTLKTVNVEDSTQVIYAHELKTFSLKDIEGYKKNFRLLQRDQIIAEGEFDDNTWKLIGFWHHHFLIFNLDMYPELLLKLKCLCILKLHDKNMIAQSVVQDAKRVIEFLINSKGLSKDSFDEFVLYYNSIESELHKSNLACSCIEFFHFIGLNSESIYFDFFMKTKHIKSKSRILPNYYSIIAFDQVLVDYTLNSSLKQKERYFPLLLWWIITKIIPIRPSEFVLLKRNCCVYDEETKTYWLTVNRIKPISFLTKVNRKKIPLVNKLEVSEDIYTLINEYNNLVDPENKNKWLLSYESFSSFYSEAMQKFTESIRFYKSRFTVTDLMYLLDKFFTEIVEKKYGYKSSSIAPKNKVAEISIQNNILERVRLGDTRHLAFCNMLIQGFNPLTIARIGGHEDLYSQMSYHNHMYFFAQSAMYSLSRRLTIPSILGTSYTTNNIFNTQELIVRSRLTKTADITLFRRIEDGYCKDKHFPNSCTGDCLFCKHYILDLINYPEAITKIKTKSYQLEKEIRIQLQLMVKISNEAIINRRTLTLNPAIDEKLKQLSGRLSRIMAQKALIDSYLMEEGIYEMQA